MGWCFIHQFCSLMFIFIVILLLLFLSLAKVVVLSLLSLLSSLLSFLFHIDGSFIIINALSLLQSIKSGCSLEIIVPEAKQQMSSSLKTFLRFLAICSNHNNIHVISSLEQIALPFHDNFRFALGNSYFSIPSISCTYGIASNTIMRNLCSLYITIISFLLLGVSERENAAISFFSFLVRVEDVLSLQTRAFPSSSPWAFFPQQSCMYLHWLYCTYT